MHVNDWDYELTTCEVMYTQTVLWSLTYPG